jgi:hypothetical protein
MKMSDKEFDQLFNAKLTDLEIEPSAELWGKITPEIPGNSKDSSGLMPMMSIAATLVVILAAGLLFRPSTPKVVLHGQYNPQQVIAETVPVVKSGEPIVDPYQGLTPEQRTVQQPQQIAVEGKHQVINKVESKGVDPVESIVDTMQNMAYTKPLNITKPDHSDNNFIKTNIPVTNTIANVAPKADALTNPARAIAMNPQETKMPEAVKKKKIHNLGDLLNVVIAKVDKRDNKIIQFGSGSDDDDDDLLNVTGVNLGPIKVKKQN